MLAGSTGPAAARVVDGSGRPATVVFGRGSGAVTVLSPGLGPAYWLAGEDGGVFSFGDASFAGSLSGQALGARIVGIAGTPNGKGYWLAGADGGVFSFGDAPYAGSAAGQTLHAPIVGIAATPNGKGYWLAGADGGVFSFGDAPYLGSAAGQTLHAPIVGIAATPTGKGYWLAGLDGGVFSFGDAPYSGSAAGQNLRGFTVGIAATPTGKGYWLAGLDGGVFSFGDASYLGSAAGQTLGDSISGISATWNGAGYWLVGRDGGVFGFGNAGYFGSRGGRSLHGPIVGMVSALAPPVAPPAPTLDNGHGYDISWPQCGGAYPSTDVSFAVVGVTGGKAFTANLCLADEARWSRGEGRAGGLYMNLSAPDATDSADPAFSSRTTDGHEGSCDTGDEGCKYGNFGGAAADAAWSLAAAQGLNAPMWWLDVETGNTWTSDGGLNGRIIRGAVAALRAHGVAVGLYSTGLQWQAITGGLNLGLPVWVAGAPDPGSAGGWCDGRVTFNGGQVWLVQALPRRYDEDAACPPLVARTPQVFVLQPPFEVPLVVAPTVVRLAPLE